MIQNNMLTLPRVMFSAAASFGEFFVRQSHVFVSSFQVQVLLTLPEYPVAHLMATNNEVLQKVY